MQEHVYWGNKFIASHFLGAGSFMFADYVWHFGGLAPFSFELKLRIWEKRTQWTAANVKMIQS